MPTGNCKFPEHHGSPSSGPPVTLLLAILAGAGIVAYARTIVVVLAVVAVLGIMAAGVVMLFHAHASEPYDAAYRAPERHSAALASPVVVHVHNEAPRDRSEALRAENAALRAELAAANTRAIEAPQQHVHFHGISAGDVAELVHRQPVTRPALEEYR